MVRISPIRRGSSARVGEQFASEPAIHHSGFPPEMQHRVVQPWSTGRKRAKGYHMEFFFGVLSGLSLHQHEEELFKSISLGWYTLGKREGFTMCCEHSKGRGLTTALWLSEMGCSFSAHKPMSLFLDKNTTRICIWSSKERYLNAQLYSSTFCMSLRHLCLCALLYTATPFHLSCVHLCCHLFNNNILWRLYCCYSQAFQVSYQNAHCSHSLGMSLFTQQSNIKSHLYNPIPQIVSSYALFLNWQKTTLHCMSKTKLKSTYP